METTTAPARHQITLNDGHVMPMLGLGTYLATPDEAYQSVLWALETGYRLFDTSLAYGNEVEVGRAIADSGVPREEVFITTKLENDDQGYDNALRACDRSLDNLALGYIDLYLIHWPVPRHRGESWRALERLQQEGKCRSIGVSNYTITHLKQLLGTSDTVPAVNQVEFHPFLYQEELLRFCTGTDIVLEAYTPLVQARHLDHPLLVEVGRRHGKSAAQVLLRWHIEHGTPAIPKSVHQEYIIENSEVWDFRLDGEEMGRLDALDIQHHMDWDPTEVV